MTKLVMMTLLKKILINENRCQSLKILSRSKKKIVNNLTFKTVYFFFFECVLSTVESISKDFIILFYIIKYYQMTKYKLWKFHV